MTIKLERDMVVSDIFIGIVKEAILGMYSEKKHVTVDSLLNELQNSTATRLTEWRWSRSTLYRFLVNKMNYSYGQRTGHYEQLLEKTSIIVQRIEYIKQIKKYRSEGKPIYYQDETWVTKNMTLNNVWLDENGRGGLKVPQGKGERSIICHIGGENGFVENAKLIFRGTKSKKISDYHSEMNSAVFLDWLETKVLPNVPTNSVIVLDRATYHTTVTDETRPAQSTYTKLQFAQWLCGHNIVEGDMSTVESYMQLFRPELALLCKRNKPKTVYQAEVLARRFDCVILLLPVAHPELNPIELVWGFVKSHVAKKIQNSHFQR